MPGQISGDAISPESVKRMQEIRLRDGKAKLDEMRTAELERTKKNFRSDLDPAVQLSTVQEMRSQQHTDHVERWGKNETLENDLHHKYKIMLFLNALHKRALTEHPGCFDSERLKIFLLIILDDVEILKQQRKYDYQYKNVFNHALGSQQPFFSMVHQLSREDFQSQLAEMLAVPAIDKKITTVVNQHREQVASRARTP